MCIRQLGSVDVMYSARAAAALAAFASPIAAEIMLNFTAKVPPKPQQSSLYCISTSSSPRTWRKISRGSCFNRSSRRAWHASWYATRCGNAAPTSVTLRDLDEKLGKFEHAFAELHGFAVERRAGQEFGVEIPHHRGARARGANHRFGRTKDADEAFGERTRVVPISAVERGLAATRLLRREIDFTADSTEDARGIKAHVRHELIHEAGNEERNFHVGLAGD